jgi:hypothetical protein
MRAYLHNTVQPHRSEKCYCTTSGMRGAGGKGRGRMVIDAPLHTCSKSRGLSEQAQSVATTTVLPMSVNCSAALPTSCNTACFADPCCFLRRARLPWPLTYPTDVNCPESLGPALTCTALVLLLLLSHPCPCICWQWLLPPLQICCPTAHHCLSLQCHQAAGRAQTAAHNTSSDSNTGATSHNNADHSRCERTGNDQLAEEGVSSTHSSRWASGWVTFPTHLPHAPSSASTKRSTQAASH